MSPRVSLFVPLLWLSGCSIDDIPFRCDRDSACLRSGTQGVCEADGYCSFPDDDCADTQRRYADHAPGEVAGRCVSACVTQLALGQFHSCARLADGAIRCWGDARDGQLGNGKSATESYASPVEVSADVLPAAYVSAGEDHTCAVKSPGGSVWCWGSNQGLQLGALGAKEPGPVEVPMATPKDEPAVAVAAGLFHSCSLGSWGARCWGIGKGGQLGNGLTPPVSTPVEVDWKADILEIGVGLAHTCGLPAVGKVRCWGNNDAGQLAAPTGQNQPLPFETPVNATRIAVGAGHTCALMDGKVACWGNNEQGQLGTPSPPTPKPSLVPLEADAKALAAGYAHNCAILTDGRVSCWGSNLYGQLGPNAEPGVKPSPPVIVDLGAAAAKLSCGREHTCALTENGRAYCWGRNDYGQLGNGKSGSSEANPTPDATVWKALCR